MKRLGITEGEFVVENVTTNNGDFYKVITKKGASVCNVTTRDYVKARENTQLIADAFNTANKCDMLPSELLEQRNELLDMLQATVDILNNPNSFDLVWKLKVKEMSEQLIKKATEL